VLDLSLFPLITHSRSVILSGLQEQGKNTKLPKDRFLLHQVVVATYFHQSSFTAKSENA